MRPVTRTIVTPLRPAPSPPPQQRGPLLAWLAVVLVVVILIFVFRVGHKYTGITFPGEDVTSANAIDSGYSGDCLDVLHNVTKNGTPIESSNCNGSAAQDWTTTATTINLLHGNSCVSATASGTVVLSTCAAQPGQVWLRDQQGYYNPNAGKCLSVITPGAQVRLASCSGLSTASEQWAPGSAAETPACGGNRGEAVACQAVKQWTAWQAVGSNHEALLTAYTDGTPYEEWCADFVSYLYKQAGYPFTSGSADGWDENDANAVQYMGFTMHQADSGYQPQPGDVAFFNYPGGHVEIVVSGGKTPTFVYGDSAEIDPATGNGQMKANTIVQDDSGRSGQLTYYLSPGS